MRVVRSVALAAAVCVGLVGSALFFLATPVWRPDLPSASGQARLLAGPASVRPGATRGVVRPAASRRRAAGQSLLASVMQAQPIIRSTARALVVGVTFPGTTPLVRLSHFYSVFFGKGPGTVATFLSDNSYGQFHLTGNVVGGSAAGQAGDWLLVPHSIAFYAQGNSGMGKQSAGASNTISGGDVLEQTVVRMLDRAHFNWTPYEDASGNVPYLILLVNSPDAALTGSPTQLWSYEESQSNTPIVESGVRKAMVLNYDFDAALGPDTTILNGVGTFDHEFSHILGAIDVYDSNGSIAGLANWSLMGSGNYNGPGDIGTEPSYLDAYTRLQFGWSRPTVIAGPPVLYNVAPAEISPTVLEYAIPGTTQYFLMENRQAIGSDAWLPGHGLLIYRVDAAIMNQKSVAWQNDCVECVTGAGRNPHPGIVIRQAGGTQTLSMAGSAGDPGAASDPFPGSAANTAFSDSTHPSARGWGGQPSYLSVFGITQEPSGDIVLAAGSAAARLAPAVVPATGGTVTITDPLGPFGGATRVRLAGTPSGAVTGAMVDSATTATLQIAPGTAAGAYLVQAVSGTGQATALAYLTVSPGGTAQAPVRIQLTAPPAATLGQPLTVRVVLVDAAGRPVTGRYGPVWVNGIPADLSAGGATVTLTPRRTGTFALTAALERLPSIAGAQSVQVGATAAG